MRPLFLLIRNLVVALLGALLAIVRRLSRAKPLEWVAYELDGHLERGDPNVRRTWSIRPPTSPRIHALSEFRRELDFLARIPRLRGIVLRFEHFDGSGPLLLELRAALASFRSRGKRVVVHADMLSTRDYWLASVADEVWLTPRGALDLTGFAVSSSAGAKALAKVGISVDVVRAGRFKSAGEALGAETVSDAQKEQLDTLVGDLDTLFVEDVARSLAREPAQIRALVDDGPYTARRALEAGLVHRLCYQDEIRAKLRKSTGETDRAEVGPFGRIFARHAPPRDWRPLRDRRPVVAIVDLDGIISYGRGRSLPVVGAVAGHKELVRRLDALRRDDRVKAVVLRIDSRGGHALASDLMWRAAMRLAEKKPLVAWLDSVAASGGYYVAAAAQRIVASPACITGSIGVFMMRPDASGLFARLGIDRATIRRGRRAALLHPDVPLDEDGRAALQRNVEETYTEFLAVVAQGRKMTDDVVCGVAEGRVWLAPRAQEVGLVDRLGTLDDAIGEAAKLAAIEAPRVVRLHRRRGGLFELVRLWRERDALLTELFDAGRTSAFWPGRLR